MSSNILHDVLINADISSVFEAMTEPKHLNNWWTNKCSGTAAKGAKYNLHFSPDFDWYAEVTDCTIDESFALTMIKSNQNWNFTTFGFELTAHDNDITRLSFFHRDWKSANHEFREASYYWAILLYNLKQYLEKGVIIPSAERNNY